MNGAEPVSVTAVTQQIKPDVYPRVDDEATIILEYPQAQGIVQASWNWPFSRKDMEVYGRGGYIIAPDGQHLRIRTGRDESTQELHRREPPFDDPLSYLAAVVRGDIAVVETELSSLTNNVLVVRILDAARRSAATGETVRF
jgi:predicted dehydrogenase